MQSRDTEEWAERLLVEHWRAMDSRAKAKLVRELCSSLRSLSLAGLRSRHPDADERELGIREACLRLEPELVRRISGWIPEDLA